MYPTDCIYDVVMMSQSFDDVIGFRLASLIFLFRYQTDLLPFGIIVTDDDCLV